MAETISQALQEAQKTLLKKRAEARQRRLERGLPVDQHLDPEARQLLSQRLDRETPSQPSIVERIDSLPDHLGWETDAATTAIRTALKRRKSREKEKAETVGPDTAMEKAETAAQKPSEAETTSPSGEPPAKTARTLSGAKEDTVKVYPALAAAMLKSRRAAQARVYFLMRHLDRDGRGWLAVDHVRAALTSKGSKLRIAKRKTSEANAWRNLRGLLNAGEGVFWTRDPLGRIWLRGAAKIAVALKCDKLEGYPVGLPVKHLLGKLGKVKAYLWATFHTGRERDETQSGLIHKPISQTTLREITGIPETTQRRYNKKARLQVTRNYALGPRYTLGALRTMLYDRWGNAFRFKDYRGKQGAPGREYIAFRLPNSYHTRLNQLPRGRQAKINAALAADLVTNAAEESASSTDCALSSAVTRGNGCQEAKIERLFYMDGKTAVKRWQGKKMQTDVFYPARTARRERGSKLWITLPGG